MAILGWICFILIIVFSFAVTFLFAYFIKWMLRRGDEVKNSGPSTEWVNPYLIWRARLYRWTLFAILIVAYPCATFIIYVGLKAIVTVVSLIVVSSMLPLIVYYYPDPLHTQEEGMLTRKYHRPDLMLDFGSYEKQRPNEQVIKRKIEDILIRKRVEYSIQGETRPNVRDRHMRELGFQLPSCGAKVTVYSESRHHNSDLYIILGPFKDENRRVMEDIQKDIDKEFGVVPGILA